MAGFQAGGVAPQDSQDKDKTSVGVEETKEPSVIQCRWFTALSAIGAGCLCLLAIWNPECKVGQKSKLEISLYRNMNSSSAEKHSVEEDDFSVEAECVVLDQNAVGDRDAVVAAGVAASL